MSGLIKHTGLIAAVSILAASILSHAYPTIGFQVAAKKLHNKKRNL